MSFAATWASKTSWTESSHVKASKKWQTVHFDFSLQTLQTGGPFTQTYNGPRYFLPNISFDAYNARSETSVLRRAVDRDFYVERGVSERRPYVGKDLFASRLGLGSFEILITFCAEQTLMLDSLTGSHGGQSINSSLIEKCGSCANGLSVRGT